MYHCDDSENHSEDSWLLALYLIPGCVGRGVRLGSEGSSVGGGGGGVWKFGIQKMEKIKIIKI